MKAIITPHQEAKDTKCWYWALEGMIVDVALADEKELGLYEVVSYPFNTSSIEYIIHESDLTFTDNEHSTDKAS